MAAAVSAGSIMEGAVSAAVGDFACAAFCSVQGFGIRWELKMRTNRIAVALIAGVAVFAPGLHGQSAQKPSPYTGVSQPPPDDTITSDVAPAAKPAASSNAAPAASASTASNAATPPTAPAPTAPAPTAPAPTVAVPAAALPAPSNC